MKIRFLSPAEHEMLEAALFYENQAVHLGIDFLERVRTVVSRIAENPSRYPIIRLSIRRSLVARFPYCILYKIDSDEVVIVAVMHLKRHPNYWIGRL